MDYFWLRQDSRYLHLPNIRNFIRDYRRADFTVEKAHKIAERNVVFVNSDKPLDYGDVIDKQLFLVSERVRKVFEIYEPSIFYKIFCLLDNIQGDAKLYYVPIIPVVQGTDELENFRKIYRTEGRIILKKRFFEDRSIVRISELTYDGVIIRLDVAESLLRRGIHKLSMTRLTLE